MCTTGGKFSSTSFIDHVISEECMAKSKLSQTMRKAEIQAEHCDLPCWRTTDNLEICNETLLSKYKLKNHSAKVDQIFRNETDRRA